ncbi:rubredoxin [Ilyobacter polytropus]|uniref:Rubredoxin n=1 Tax=Ilyobacter polytropus (strain ATCC 51220 / DSM 2926 / LMG 16218 / CuHBu1) TaxID=572544 RepID=E3HBE5_ILYPC|nr:rubredoxin [Ilyobacter polytropus]ADO83760.1 Rubredoxin-type Fe(Cys)4 protein [Ilyobacter polytropus DSM 2926]
MKKWVCTICGYVYDPERGDPENGVEPGTSFENIPEEWLCPICAARKDEFEDTLGCC